MLTRMLILSAVRPEWILMIWTDTDCRTVFWNLELHALQRWSSNPSESWLHRAGCPMLNLTSTTEWTHGKEPAFLGCLRRRLRFAPVSSAHSTSISWPTNLPKPSSDLGCCYPQAGIWALHSSARVLPSSTPCHVYTPTKGTSSCIHLGVSHSGASAHVVLT